MFRGEFSLNLDAKGRLAVPSRYREPLLEIGAGRLIATISLMDPCLVVYPLPDWQKIEQQLRSLPALDRKAQTIRQLLIGRAADLELDTHGRVLLPQHLREFAKLEKRVKMVGQVNNFELWNEEAWQAWCADQLAQVHTGELLKDQSEALSALVLN
ncbi:MAG: division/cell wall cluster transcriptional repressor MraZ [Gammaproteobacteria bacterium]